MKEIKTIIIDDEPHSRDELHHLLSEHKDINVVAMCEEAQSGLLAIMDKEPDLVFLDIDMPKTNGLELASSLSKLKKKPKVVFATAHEHYAAKAFRVQAFDYLLKPFDEDELSGTLKRYREQCLSSTKDKEPTSKMLTRLAIDENDKIHYIDPLSILYMAREERETVIRTKDKEYRIRTALKELKQKLAGYPFVQTHKSYIINIAEIDGLIPWFNGAYQVKLKGIKDEVPASRTYVKTLREQLEL
ncbi:LytTR family DNA-binding domain-containing protein [Alkalihalophilus lindianensis]|uniref:LytTR family DNA-binding domain-containing protein n=1 Tax=Alkalihalophilus lindianensis TaxID=1630542 RepID=A0ABU3XAT9_9BACI|nr:LytTR family DNA-binding domain-containing protein [Alkalihalophilus lindianensis]MDV2685002.1 LytTR family DNA-binding domain-containing protein [Alkalihalophilus lindianensis]